MKFSIITLFLFLLTSSCTSNKNKKNEQENDSVNHEVLLNNSETKRLNNLIEALKERLSEDIKKEDAKKLLQHVKNEL